MGTQKDFNPVDSAVADLLVEVVTASGLSYRKLRETTGISINRIGKILRQEPPPATMGEISEIAAACGTRASVVVGEAESRAMQSEARDPRLASADFTLAAKRAREGPLDGQGAPDHA